MDNTARLKLMDSLTNEQREGIAEIIRSASVEGDYYRDADSNSIWVESVSETLESLALYFKNYDPESALH